MEHTVRRAVIAIADSASEGPVLQAVKSTGAEICAFSRTAADTVEQVRNFLPDLLVADLILPGADGIHLARHILALPLVRYPGIILLDPAGYMPSEENQLAEYGVTVIPKPHIGEMIAPALQAITPEKRMLPPGQQAHLASLMDELGVPDHPGRRYLSDAAALAWMDNRYLSSLKSRLYTSVAHKHSTDAARVERAMRYAIDTAWRNGEITRQHRIFGDTIDARRGKPTCGEMIARLADILRWEGRQ